MKRKIPKRFELHENGQPIQRGEVAGKVQDQKFDAEAVIREFLNMAGGRIFDLNLSVRLLALFFCLAVVFY